MDKAIAAETSPAGLAGKAYFDKTTGNTLQEPDDVGGVQRGNWDIYRAAEFARDAGFYVTEDNNEQTFGTAPAPTAPGAALYVGTHNLGHYNDAFTWNTGAIGFDFNSDAAANFRQGARWCGGALARGITVTGGAIDEPFAPLIAKYDGVLKNLFEGANVGDALARNTPALKWKLINIGDPLYRPALGRNGTNGSTPSNWTTVDINASPGAVYALRDTAKIPGTPPFSGFAVRSSGDTLFGLSDSCTFSFTTMNADMIDFMVRVSRTEAAGEAAAAGLMFRESTSPDSRHVALVVNSDGQLYMRERTQPG